jgi:hypothetical protein
MLRQFSYILGGVVIGLSVLSGCSNSAVTGPTDSGLTTATDPYAVLKVDATDFTDFSEIPTADQVMASSFVQDSPTPFSNPDSLHRKGNDGGNGGRGPGKGGPKPGDSTGHGKDTTDHDRDTTGHGKDTTGHHTGDTLGNHKGDTLGHRNGDTTDHRGRGKQFGHLNVDSYKRVVKALNLTAEQDSLIRICFAAYRDCSNGAARDYGSARKTLADSMNSAMRGVKAQVDAGTLTKDQARQAIATIQQNYRTQVQALLTTYQSAIDGCRTAFDSCVRAILTADQLAIWESLVR